HRAQTKLQIADNLLRASGMPNPFGAHEPAVTINEFLRLGIEPPLDQNPFMAQHDRAQMVIREIGEKDLAMSDKTHGKSQGRQQPEDDPVAPTPVKRQQ